MDELVVNRVNSKVLIKVNVVDLNLNTTKHGISILILIQYNIPAKPLHNSDTVSVHFNHFYCMGICDKLSRQLYMLTYIYLNVDGC